MFPVCLSFMILRPTACQYANTRAGGILRYDYVWRTAKSSNHFQDETMPIYTLRPPDDLNCWPDRLCNSLACVPDGIDSYTPRDIANLCNCYRLCCVPTMSIETTKINCFGRDRDDPGMLERVRHDLDKRYHFESKVERLNLPYVLILVSAVKPDRYCH